MERHIYHHETIDGSLVDVLGIMGTWPTEILGPYVDLTGSTDDPIHRLQAHFAGSDVSKRVVISHEDLEELAPGTYRMRISWHAIDHTGMYPVMTGELEVTGLSTAPPRCEVAFLGHYRPPLGFVGAIADRVVGHRIAQEAVNGFVRDVCRRVTTSLDEHSTAGAA
jgi:hypothetical protein